MQYQDRYMNQTKCQKFKMKISFHLYIWGIKSLTDLIVKLEKSGLVFLYCLKMLSFMWQQFCKKGATAGIKWQICNNRDIANEWAIGTKEYQIFEKYDNCSKRWYYKAVKELIYTIWFWNNDNIKFNACHKWRK